MDRGEGVVVVKVVVIVWMRSVLVDDLDKLAVAARTGGIRGHERADLDAALVTKSHLVDAARARLRAGRWRVHCGECEGVVMPMRLRLRLR